MLDIARTREAFRTSAAAVRGRRDVIEIGGSDAADYLDGQLSQDVAGLAVGEPKMTLLLQPQGKLDAWLRLTNVDNGRYWLDIEAGFGEAALTRLLRFKLRVDVEATVTEMDIVALRGPAVAELGELAVPTGGAVLDALWLGVVGIDLVGPSVEIPAGVSEGPAEALDGLRVELGIPAMGAELTESTIPAAAGIVNRSADFTKGCYVGQELVARIDSRGSNTPTRLVSVRFSDVVTSGDADVPTDGAPLLVGDDQVGELTSVVALAGEQPIGLAYLKRAVEAPSTVEVVGSGDRRLSATLSPIDLSAK